MRRSCNCHVSSFSVNQPPDDCSPVSTKPLGIAAATYTFIYDYPLTHAARFPHALDPTSTLVDVLLLARADYEAIYAAEEKEVGNPGNVNGMLNRAATNGPYGIWGHHLDDLYFEGVDFDPVKKVVRFDMGS